MEEENEVLRAYWEKFYSFPPLMMTTNYADPIYIKLMKDAISLNTPITIDILGDAFKNVIFDVAPDNYFENRTDLVKYFNDNFDFIKNQKINFAQSNGGFKDNDDSYFTDQYFYVEFENGYKFKCSTLFYSLGEFEISKDILKPNYDCWIIDSLHDRKIIDFEITGFSEEYEINPLTGETRPAGGDYYREIHLKLDNGKTLTIVAEDSESDGYMDIFIK